MCQKVATIYNLSACFANASIAVVCQHIHEKCEWKYHLLICNVRFYMLFWLEYYRVRATGCRQGDPLSMLYFAVSISIHSTLISVNTFACETDTLEGRRCFVSLNKNNYLIDGTIACIAQLDAQRVLDQSTIRYTALFDA